MKLLPLEVGYREGNVQATKVTTVILLPMAMAS